MTLTRYVPVCLLSLCLACQLGSSSRDGAAVATSTPPPPICPAVASDPAPPPACPRHLVYDHLSVPALKIALACGVTETSAGKLWPMLAHDMQMGATHFGVVIKFSADVTDRYLEGLGPQVERVGDRDALGHHLSFAELEKVCQDPRVSRVESTPEYKLL